MKTDETRRLVEAVTRKLLEKLGSDLDTLRVAGIGVTIFAFTFDAGAIAYISTAAREDMLGAVKEWIAMQEAGLRTGPPGEKAQG